MAAEHVEIDRLGSSQRAAATLQRLLQRIAMGVEAVAAALLAAEVCILFAGVISRYAIHRPLVWVDELASMLFIWLGMLGAVIALRRAEHMRLTTFLDMMGPAWKARSQVMSATATLGVLLFLLPPAVQYTLEQGAIVNPITGLADAWRVAALPVGLALMALFSLGEIVLSARASTFVKFVVLGAVIALALWFGRESMTAIGNWNLLVFFVFGIGILIALGVPIAFGFVIATCAFLLTVSDAPIGIVVGRLDGGMSGIVLLAIPLFILLGHLIVSSGLARAMVLFLVALLGHVRGGLSYVLVVAMYLVSGISGAKAADMAAVAPVLFPEMKKRGADHGELVALLAASGAMAETIPPSIVLIMIGSVASVSISALFIGGLLPALVGALALMLVVFFRARRSAGELPSQAALAARVPRAPAREVGKAFLISLPALFLPLLIRAAVVEGVATATEVSTIGVVYALLAGTVIYRQLQWKRLYPMLIETAALSGAILFIVATASAMAWALTQSGLAHDIAAVLSNLGGGRYIFLMVSIVIFVVLGSLLEGPPAILVFGPLMFPIARAMGVHDVQYSMVVILAMGLGLFAPPFGVGYYYACAIGKVSPALPMKKIWVYLGALLVSLMLVALVPWLSIGFLA